jgi:hypothetical protein
MATNKLFIHLALIQGLITLNLGAQRKPLETPISHSEVRHSTLLSKTLVNVNVSGPTLLAALFQVGQLSNECIGAMVDKASLAEAGTPHVAADSITVGDLLAKLLNTAHGVKAYEEDGCIIIAKTGNEFHYLKTRIPSFRTPRSALEMQSFHLFQALSATEPQPAHKGAWGMAYSIIGRSQLAPDRPIRCTSRAG